MSAHEPAGERTFEIVVITGLSGSGKTLAIRAFEDLGYFCVDNLPVALIPVFADLCSRRPDVSRTALVVDIREGTFLKEFPAMFDALRRGEGRRVRLIFFEADDDALIRRFSETRTRSVRTASGTRMVLATSAFTSRAACCRVSLSRLAAAELRVGRD